MASAATALDKEQRPAIPRLDGVDLLRGFSIIAVILLHISIRMQVNKIPIRPLLPPWLSHLLFTNGSNGVTVFFAISGFLITLTSIRRFGSLADIQPRRFYRIRFARIAPLLLALLAVLSILHLMRAAGFVILPTRSTLPSALFAALTFHLNWLEAAHGYLPPTWDVLWSLSVEEMFYLFFPIACVLLLRLRRGTGFFIGLLLIFIAMGPFARTVWTTNDIWREKSYLGGMDAIALGCLTALLTNRLVRRRIRLSVLMALEMAGAGMLLVIALWPGWRFMRLIGVTGLDGTMLALGTCFIMFATVQRGGIGTRWMAPIRWFGRHSYEVYMTHEFIIVWGTMLYIRTQRGPLLLWLAAMFLLTAPLGALVARYFSEPLNARLRGARRAVANSIALEPAHLFLIT